MGLFHKSKKNRFYDLHMHVLPGMDDGSPDVETSMGMIREEIRQGSEGIIATPHYYAEESIPDYIIRRQKAYDKLEAAIEKELPEWTGRLGMGSEVAYNEYLASDPDLSKLCFGHSNYLLLEMPFTQWTDKTLRDVQLMMNSQGLRIIIAHLERFPEYTSEDTIEALLDMDVIIQMNSGALLHRNSKRRALQMVKNDITQVLGTDSHNLDSRRPNIADGLAVLEKSGLDHQVQSILSTNEHIYHAAMGADPS